MYLDVEKQAITNSFNKF